MSAWMKTATDLPDWTGAACVGVDTDVFYPSVKGPGSDRSKMATALAYCDACPLVARCLDYVMAEPDYYQHGVWGGTTPGERMALRRRRRANA